MSSIPWNQFGKLTTVDQITEYLDGREFSHDSYFHYTKLENLDLILQNGYFKAGCVCEFNDSIEREHFDEPQNVFMLCFSTGIHENLPMWYLYSSLNGCGGRICISGKKIRHFIDSLSFSLTELVDGRPVGIEEPLVVGTDITVYFRDVLYCDIDDSRKSSVLSIKYNTMTNYNIPTTEQETLNSKMNGFNKSLIWYYEKETRLVIQLKGSVTERIVKGKKYGILVRFDEKSAESMKITLGPGISDSTDSIYKVIEPYEHIKEFMLSTSSLKPSKYSGKINMNLCKYCTKA